MTDATQQTKHTPGPWKWYVKDGWWRSEYAGLMPYLESRAGKMVCDYGTRSNGITDEGGPPNRFDRPLIAAAPDILDALCVLVSSYRRGEYPSINDWRAAENAINLAINGEAK